MLSSIHPHTFQQLLLGTGVLFTRLDHRHITTAAALRDCIQKAMADPHALLGATKGPGELHIKPMYHQLALGSQRTPAAGSIRVDGWTVRITGTLAEVTPHTLAALLPFTHVTPAEDCTAITLSAQPFAATPIPRLVWVGDTGMGLMLVKIPQAVNTLGVELKLNHQGEGTMPFSFLGQLEPGADQGGAPCLIRFFQDE